MTYVAPDGSIKHYVGDNCQYGDVVTCNGRGVVSASGQCACDSNHFGPACEYTGALNLCNHARWSQNMSGGGTFTASPANSAPPCDATITYDGAVPGTEETAHVNADHSISWGDPDYHYSEPDKTQNNAIVQCSNFACVTFYAI